MAILYTLTERICHNLDENKTLDDPTIYESEKHTCNGVINLKKIHISPNNKIFEVGEPASDNTLLSVPKDGIYIFQLLVDSPYNKFTANTTVKFIGSHGMLTAKDLPLLHFYAFMCLYYSLLAIFWMIVSSIYWRQLLRIQFWVGAVILLGMMEKAMFYFEYHQANSIGYSSMPLALSAELISCIKRTLSRVLVLYISMGFGIIKARIGDESVVRISVMSSLYFTMASIESYLRLAQTESRNENRQLVLAAVPLALIDSLICYWIFTSLIQTIRALRLRRNPVKLQFYVHFKNVLIFGVTMSITFMIYSIKIHKETECAWKNLWVDISFWHVLFSILLTVIAFLWRPTKNNQQYAFAPLLNDNDDEEEEEVHFSAEKHETLSKVKTSNSSKQQQLAHNDRGNHEEDSMMKWVEENIANSSILLDSDDELMNTKFEVSKMQ
ncbi:hypothetical protein PVAND_014725 [Polypedilum vanderplanki]|uniref:GOST seven transmembrane domain-containing protein n=1 Tax=Polypedilum vanderplanki TaxID=319348 RepID=A0A9J6BAT0_POLVA|nr:hypothetical protein PVAND_014725 [Polypedilum vanderplanki]